VHNYSIGTIARAPNDGLRISAHGPIFARASPGQLPEREHDRNLIADAQVATIRNGGDFLPLDRPQGLCELIFRFAGK
jgi:hypothetical protein